MWPELCESIGGKSMGGTDNDTRGLSKPANSDRWGREARVLPNSNLTSGDNLGEYFMPLNIWLALTVEISSAALSLFFTLVLDGDVQSDKQSASPASSWPS